MKISDLIDELTVLMLKYGDVEVVMGEACQGDPVDPSYYNAKEVVVL